MSLADAAERAVTAEKNFRDLNGAALIEAATLAICDTQAELARLSGLTANTITAIKKGKRATKAQKNAMAFAVLKRWH